MGRKKISTTVYLDEEQLIALKAMTASSGAPMAHTIRLAINGYISQAIANGSFDAEAMRAVSVNPNALHTTRGAPSARNMMEEETIERVLRRLLAERGSDA